MKRKRLTDDAHPSCRTGCKASHPLQCAKGTACQRLPVERKSNANPHERAYMALRVIRTWASFDLEHPHYKRTLDPAHVLKLCDEAIEAASKQGGA